MQEIAKLFADQAEANTAYKELFTKLEEPVLKAIELAKAENKLDATQLKNLKDAAKELFELGDRIRPGWRAYLNRSAIPGLSESSGAAAVKGAIISEFPEYALKFVKDGQVPVKNEPVAVEVAKRLRQFGLDVPSDDEKVDELFDRIVDTKYSRQTSKAERAIQALAQASSQTPTVQTLIKDQTEGDLIASKRIFDAAVQAEIARLTRKAQEERDKKSSDASDTSRDAALELEAKKYDAFISELQQ
jgi:hypothetical protein